jgi:hypothetical protein
VTAPDLNPDAERAARVLAKGLEHVPATFLADPYAFAVRYVQWLIADYWRRIEPVSGPLPADHAPPRPDTYPRGAARARAALKGEDPDA